jgi:hypothetical protein
MKFVWLIIVFICGALLPLQGGFGDEVKFQGEIQLIKQN